MAEREQSGATGSAQPSVSEQPSGSDSPSFEEAFAKLRQTVEALEAGDLPLAEATRLYEEGMALAKACNQALTTAELRITKLQKDYAAEAALASEDRSQPDPSDEPEA